MRQDFSLAQEYKRRVIGAFDGCVAKVVLYGSRARDDARPDSDWDIAVFLTDDPTRIDRYRLTDLGTDVLVDTGEVIQPLALPLRRIRSDGIGL
jgi:predicted nucleotidyltransferase